MFNAANILEALKNYIRIRGGTSNAYNIAEAVNDLNSIPQGSGGDIPPEVSNAVETHGMGWTSEEEVPAINIEWDGNTEGKESIVDDEFFKILDNNIPDSVMEGGNVELIYGEEVYSGDAFIVDSSSPAITVFGFHSESTAGGSFDNAIIVIHENTTIEEMELSKGVYFYKPTNNIYVSSFTKEASTEEVVHQIDQKYIPQSSGGGMFVTVTFHESLDDGTADKTVDEIIAAVLAGKDVKAKVLMGDDMDLMVLNFSILVTGDRVTFGPSRYSPSKDGNYPMLEGMIDDDRDVWTLDG